MVEYGKKEKATRCKICRGADMCLHKELKEKTIIKKASFECNKIRRTWGLIELYEQDASHEPRPKGATVRGMTEGDG